MGTKDLVVALFMGAGIVLAALTGLNVSDGHYKDIIFFPAGVCLFMIGMALDRFWKAA